MSKIRKKYKISIKIRNCETIFDDRFDPGVIGSAKFTYTALDNNKFDSPLFTAQLNKSATELIDKFIEILYKDITDE